jgi:hypothetical protein
LPLLLLLLLGLLLVLHGCVPPVLAVLQGVN